MLIAEQKVFSVGYRITLENAVLKNFKMLFWEGTFTLSPLGHQCKGTP